MISIDFQEKKHYISPRHADGKSVCVEGDMKEYFKSVIAESKAVVWPSKKKVYQDTIVVVLALVFGGAFIAAVDYGLTELLRFAILGQG